MQNTSSIFNARNNFIDELVVRSERNTGMQWKIISYMLQGTGYTFYSILRRVMCMNDGDCGVDLFAR